MFSKFTISTSTTTTTTKAQALTSTTKFVAALQEEGFRLSYGALALAARLLGENSSNQKLGQRGSGLAKSLPKPLQWTICRKNGGYHKKVLEAFRATAPEGFEAFPVIGETGVPGAVEAWVASTESPPSS